MTVICGQKIVQALVVLALLRPIINIGITHTAAIKPAQSLFQFCWYLRRQVVSSEYRLFLLVTAVCTAIVYTLITHHNCIRADGYLVAISFDR